MSQLRSALDQLKMLDPDSISVEELDTEVVEAIGGIQTLQVLVSVWVNSMGNRGGHHDLGYSSASAYLCDRGRLAPAHAKQIVSLGSARENAPAAFHAWADGRISSDQAKPLFRAAEAVPDVYPDAEAMLVDAVEGLDAVDTRKAVEYWRQSVDGPGDLDSETHQLRRGLHVSRTTGGMRRVDGWLTPTAGQAVEAALEANMPPPRDGDTRTPRQRRHDALENLCRDWLDNGTTPTVGGEKPHIMLHADLPALQGIAGGLHETTNGDIIDVDTLRQVACDCSITRIVLGPDSEVVDIGRKTRVWTTAQRRAIIARDRHCQGPGCGATPKYCDIHHEDHWADGGTTSVDKGKLFCRPCHTQEHAKDKFRRRLRQRT